MLERDKKARISSKEALEHVWFDVFCRNTLAEEGESLDEGVLDALWQHRGQSMLKKAVLNVFVKTLLRSEEIEHLQHEFQKIDTDFTGTIDAQELQIALKKCKR